MDVQFLSPQEVAEILQIKKNTVYDMIKRGDLKAVKMGKQFRIAKSVVYEYLGMKAGEGSSADIVICGQDMLLDTLCVLFNRNRHDGIQVFRSPLGSYNGLYEMYQKENYVATCHLWDGETDTYNLSYVTKMLPGESLSVFHLIKRWQGFYVKKGNPKGITQFRDLARDDVRMINREKGSGIRVFFDEMCKRQDLSPADFNGYNDVAASHTLAATSVDRGNADVAMGNQKTADSFEGIDFIPLKQESYDIVFRKSDLEHSQFQDLLDCIRSEDFRKEAESISGYDASGIGDRLM